MQVRARALGAVVCLLIAFAALPAGARSLADDFVEAWTTRDGLPHSTIHGIGQTADGYLWLATWECIARYNGHDFRLYRRGDVPGLGDDSVRALHVGPTGDLWVGSARGGIVRWHAGRWEAWPTVGELITDLLETRDGHLLVATTRGGIVRLGKDGSRATIRAAQGLPSDSVNALAQDSRGRVWAATSHGLALVRADGATSEVGPGLPAGPTFSLFAEPGGALLVGTEHGAFRGAGGVFEAVHPGLAQHTATRLWRDTDGTTWVGTNNGGLARVDAGRIEWLNSDRGLPNDRILALRRDTEGSLWIGTNGGLARVRPAPIHTFTRGDGLSDDFVRATLADRDGTVWIGSGRGLDRADAATGAITRTGIGTRLAAVSVLSLAQDAAGDLLVGTFHDGLLRLRGGAVVDSITMANGLPSNEVRAIVAGRDGRLWLGTKQGVVLQDGGRLRVFGVREGLPTDYVQALYQDAEGTVWVGTGSGLATIRDGVVRRRSLGDSDARYVYGFLPSSDGHAMWAATDRGLVRVPAGNGAVRRVGRAEGLPFEKIFAALRDPRGRVWLTGSEGIVRLRMDDLESAAAGSIKRLDAHLFGRADGMISAQANGGSMPAATLDRRGRLWVATALGVARLDPAATTRRTSLLPPIAIERFEVDGREVDPRVPPALPPGDHRIVVRFASPTLLDSQRVRYRYRLEGLGLDWVELGDSREVQFTHLGPHRFRLHLEARVPGEARVAQSTVEFSIEPFWWQRPLVWALLGLALVLLLGALYVMRIRQLRRSETRLRRLVDERTAALQVQTQIAERVARTDSLTNLASRRALDQAIDHDVQGLAHAHSICLMLVDVDGFKPINDMHGHPAGDRALREVAEVIRAHARQQDVAARWGGDEFGLLLVDCTIEQALAVAERVRRAVAAIDCSGFAPGLSISASIGVASNGARSARALRLLVPRADEALYRAKREGRNRVCAAVEPEVLA